MKDGSIIEEAFRTEAVLLTDNQDVTDNLWKEIATAYSKKGRYYHNLAHLDNVITELLPVKKMIRDWQTLVFSVAYHDFIYDPLKQDNEEKSAKTAADKLGLLNLPKEQQDKCIKQILATKNHHPTTDADSNYLTDADLAILGCNNNAYDEYAKQIRKEYRYYPNIIYNPGRKKVLKHFLQMEKIFKTAFFADKYEEQARINIKREIQQLS